MSKTFVSVGIICYNQAHFIEKAIVSVLNQKTDYSMELLICDDASEDNTSDIVNTYIEKSAIPINYLRLPDRNGPLANGHQFLKAAKGKYICWLDADDYWDFEYKVQMQIDFLESNPDYSGCFHDAKIISDIDTNNDISNQLNEQTHGRWKRYSQFNTYQPDFYPWDVLQRKIIPTASLIVRNRDLSSFFACYSNVNLSVSWALQLELIKNSKFKYFNQEWSVYYDHAKGFSKSFDLVTFKLNNINILSKLIDDEYYCHLKNNVYRAIANEYFFLLHSSEAQNRNKMEYLKYCKEYKKWIEKATKEEIESFKAIHKQKNKK